MDKIFEQRIVMVHSLITALKNIGTSTYQGTSEFDKTEIKAIDEIISLIRKNDKKHFLSLPVNISCLDYVTYAYPDNNPLDVPKRVLTPFGLYCSRYYSEQFNKISENCFGKFYSEYIKQLSDNITKN